MRTSSTLILEDMRRLSSDITLEISNNKTDGCTYWKMSEDLIVQDFDLLP
jgi:hypothetical protein